MDVWYGGARNRDVLHHTVLGQAQKNNHVLSLRKD